MVVVAVLDHPVQDQDHQADQQVVHQVHNLVVVDQNQEVVVAVQADQLVVPDHPVQVQVVQVHLVLVQAHPVLVQAHPVLVQVLVQVQLAYVQLAKNSHQQNPHLHCQVQ